MGTIDGTCEYVLDPDRPDTWNGADGGPCRVPPDRCTDAGVWECPHSAEQTTSTGQKRCIFHLPLEEKDDDAVVSEFLRLTTEDSGDGGATTRENVEFIGARFGALELPAGESIGNDRHGRIYLSHASFANRVDLTDAELSAGVAFDGATFRDDVAFRNAAFDEETTFVGAEFEAALDCAGLDAAARLSFRDTTFCGDVTFSRLFGETVCAGPTYFKDAEFQADAQFENATFADDVYFGPERGDAGAFDGTVFAADGDFNLLTVEGEAVFTEATIHSADFEAATFNGRTWFGGATFDTAARFTGAEFGGRVDFEGDAGTDRTLFRCRPNFRSASFDDPASFQAVKFVPGAVFDDATFVAPVSFQRATFGGPASFEETEFLQQASFGTDDDASAAATFEAPPDFQGVTAVGADFSHVGLQGAQLHGSELSDAEFIEAKLHAAEFLEEADCTGANFDGAELPNATFREADLESADFTDATLRQATLERATLSNADLFGADISGARLYGARLGDVGVNTETMFDATGSHRCVYDPRSEYEYDPDDGAQVEQIVKAMGTYHLLEQVARANTLPDEQATFFVRRQDMRRAHLRRTGSVPYLNYLFAVIQNSIFRHGEGFGRVLVWSIGVITAFTFIYPAGGWMTSPSTGPITYPAIAEQPLLLWTSFYHSALVFLTGGGPLDPTDVAGELLLMTETITSPILLALLVFVLGRRAAR